jgi:hypothetical protein
VNTHVKKSNDFDQEVNKIGIGLPALLLTARKQITNHIPVCSHSGCRVTDRIMYSRLRRAPSAGSLQAGRRWYRPERYIDMGYLSQQPFCRAMRALAYVAYASSAFYGRGVRNGRMAASSSVKAQRTSSKWQCGVACKFCCCASGSGRSKRQSVHGLRVAARLRCQIENCAFIMSLPLSKASGGFMKVLQPLLDEQHHHLRRTR